MFKFEDLKSIHLEVTSNCQASCPMCARNHHGGIKNPLLKINEWTLDDFKKIITEDVANTVEKIYFCGNFGDPILNDQLIDMCQHAKDLNYSISINIHTNGGARKPDWWKDLARSLPENHFVYFGIDGLEDTHHLYRVGTKYENVINNAKAFIDAGGSAEWTFIKFKHNEHQVDECKQRAKQLGFKRFMLKNSSRFLVEPKFNVYDKQGNTTHSIEPSSDTKMHFISKEILNSYKTVVKEAKVECYVQSIKEIYIDAYKTIMPCCWVSSIPYTYYDSNHINADLSGSIKSQYSKLISDFGGIEKLSALNGIQSVIDSSIWQSIWDKKWNEEKLITCARVCGKFETIQMAQPNDQFIETTVII